MLLNIVTGVFNRKKVEMRKQVYIYSVWHTHGEFPDATYAYCAYHFAEELPKMRVIEDWDEKPTDEYPCSLCKPCNCGCWQCK
jgi:hypothetical protein